MNGQKVKYIELRPAEFRKRLQQKPLAYLPLGTVEWHGEHLPLGVDAIAGEALMLECARQFGGIVLPVLFLGPDRRMDRETGGYLVGMDYGKTTSPHRQLEGSAYWVPDDFFKQLLEKILEQLSRAGFKAVFADGHGPSRRIWTEMIPAWEEKYNLQLFGVTEEIKPGWQYMIDHAAENETAIMLQVQPGLVDLSVYKEGEQSPVVGVNGGHPCLATAENGKEYLLAAVTKLQSLLGKV